MSNYKIEVKDKKAVLSLNQDLVASVSDALRTDLRKLLTDGITEVSVDMTGVELVDSMGIGFLVSMNNSLQAIKGKMEVIDVSAEIMDLFKSMRLDQHFSIRGE